MFKKEIEKLIKKAVKKDFGFDLENIEIEKPQEESFGDYATNTALTISKKAGIKPMEIATKLKKTMAECQSDLLSRIETVPPGFINFFLSEKYLIKQLNRVLEEGSKYGSSKVGKGKKIIIDYSSPNIAKSFGVGHLRSTIIGQAIYNIYKFSGWECIGDNHLGDWGTQFGKVIYQLKKNKTDLKKIKIDDLERDYIDFHKQVQDNPKMEEEARNWFKKMEEGNKEAKKIWQICRDISFEEFNKIYKLLDIKIDYSLSESFYQKMLGEIISEAMEKKITSKSEGALVVKHSDEKSVPAMLLKSDGATTYLTRDLATIKYRLKRWKPDLIVYEVGKEQELYFQQLFWVANLLGWAKKDIFYHLSHGLIRFEHQKISTRTGRTIRLKEILGEAVKRAKGVINESETSRDFSDKEKDKIATEVGVGAVKYNDLSHHRSKDIIFDWDKILNLKGNSGPYIQYTYARCQSVLKKGNFRVFIAKNISKLNNEVKIGEEEKNILRVISFFPEVVKNSAQSFSPNLICNFAFDLAQKYNTFYNCEPINKAKNPQTRKLRLFLTFGVAQVLKNSLSLLGISSPERM